MKKRTAIVNNTNPNVFIFMSQFNLSIPKKPILICSKSVLVNLASCKPLSL